MSTRTRFVLYFAMAYSDFHEPYVFTGWLYVCTLCHSATYTFSRSNTAVATRPQDSNAFCAKKLHVSWARTTSWQPLYSY